MTFGPFFSMMAYHFWSSFSRLPDLALFWPSLFLLSSLVILFWLFGFPNGVPYRKSNRNSLAEELAEVKVSFSESDRGN
jgi:hypothetical protein